MAFKAINDSIEPNGLVPTLLVFGAYPYITNLDAPSLTVTQRAAVVKKAIEEIHKLRTKQQVADALSMRNGLRIDTIYNLLPNSQVLVWREGNIGQLGYWLGPYNLLTVKNKTCTIQLPYSPTPFRIMVVKPYFLDLELNNNL